MYNLEPTKAEKSEGISGRAGLGKNIFSQVVKQPSLPRQNENSITCRVEGNLDHVDGAAMSGWVWSPDYPQDVLHLRVRLGGIELFEIQANQFRPDLRLNERRNGYHGFAFNLPMDIHPSAVGNLTFEVYIPSQKLTVRVFDHLEGFEASCIPDMLNIMTVGLFDKSYYSVTNSLNDRVNPVAHYILTGRYKGAKPNILFDPSFYTKFQNHLGAKINLEDALFHYAIEGERCGVRPHPVFDPIYIQEEYKNCPNEGVLSWFLVEGFSKDLSPSFMFRRDWYRKKYRVIESALYHFLTEGLEQGFSPNIALNLRAYATNHGISFEEALDHYVLSDLDLSDCICPLVSKAFIEEQIQALENVPRRGTSLEKYFALHTVIDPHPLFNSEYLRSRHPLSDGLSPLEFYLEQGDTSIRPHPLFWDDEYYRSRPDVLAEKIAPLEHYLLSGHRETVQTHPLIDHDFLRTSLDGQCLTPLHAYLEKARSENLSPRPSYPIDGSRERNWHKRVLSINSYSEQAVSRPPSVGVFAHIYYVDLIDEFIEIARNLPTGARFFVSTDTIAKALVIEKAFSGIKGIQLEVRALTNRGRDIAPFVVGFEDRLREVDVGLHVHSKKSPHYGMAFERWRKYLFNELAGSPTTVCAHIALLQEGSIGISAPIDFPPIDPLINWGGNRPIAASLLRAMGHVLPAHGAPEIPSGSMFWFRTEALTPLLDLHLQLEHFDAECGQVDGTLAHAIERCFFYVCEIAGFQFVRTTTAEELEGYTITDDLAWAGSRVLPSAWRPANILNEYHPEARPFASCKAEGRPRLNLLIPTADTSIGYAGVSEALRLFLGSLDELGSAWDGRIIMTDSPPSNMFIPPLGFKLVDNFLATESASRSVVAGHDRDAAFFTLREDDVMMASAWWNAAQAHTLLDDADEIFGEKNNTRRLLYLVQDDERGFYPWSTKFMMCNDTYERNERNYPVFNTPFLADYFKCNFSVGEHAVYHPPINENLAPRQISDASERDNIVLVYARPHAARNALDFVDAVASECNRRDRHFWRDWRWVAIGEDFAPQVLRTGSIYDVKGRLTLDEYRTLLGRAKLGLTIMISPHPSYPPLEMAANGVRVVTNLYGDRDLSDVHNYIRTFGRFDPETVALILREQAEAETTEPRALIDWFFGGRTNARSVFRAVADEASRQVFGPALMGGATLVRDRPKRPKTGWCVVPTRFEEQITEIVPNNKDVYKPDVRKEAKAKRSRRSMGVPK